MNDAIHQLTARSNILPPSPVAVDLLGLLCGSGYSRAQVVRLLRKDPATSTALLRAASKADVARGSSTTSVDDAVARLGKLRVRRIVVHQAFGALRIEQLCGYGMSDHVFWRMSVSCAHAAEKIAMATGLSHGTMYIVGMLLDIGKLVLEKEFRQVLTLAPGIRPDAFEREETGFDHVEIGAALAASWSLSDPIPTCIRYHHDPSQATQYQTEVACAHLASWSVNWLGIPTGIDGMAYDLDMDVLSKLGISETSMEEVSLAVLDGIEASEEPA